VEGDACAQEQQMRGSDTMLNRRHTPARGARRARAFTLVEILTVVVILGICAAVILPAVSNRDDMRASSGARLVMADLIYAQNKAISGQKPIYVWFQPDNQLYAIYDVAPTAATTTAQAIDHPLKPPTFNGKYVTAFQVANSQTERISLGTANFAGTTCLRFDELGVPQSYNIAAATVTPLTGLTIGTVPVTCGKFTLTVQVEPYTGELTVQ